MPHRANKRLERKAPSPTYNYLGELFTVHLITEPRPSAKIVQQAHVSESFDHLKLSVRQPIRFGPSVLDRYDNDAKSSCMFRTSEWFDTAFAGHEVCLNDPIAGHTTVGHQSANQLNVDIMVSTSYYPDLMLGNFDLM